jgi:outer membrane lipoprotein-sorting protein
MKSIALYKRIILSLWVVFSAMGIHSACFADDIPVQQLVTGAVEQFKKVADYTCRLNKTVRKHDELYEDKNISVKYKKPRHYYFRWESGSERGREVIFVDGRHNGKIVAHPGGPLKLITFHLDPEGYLAMKENRHSLKNSGMEKILSLIESNVALADAKNLDAISLIGKGDFDGKPVHIVEGRFPKNQGFYAYRIRLYFSPDIKLPLKATIYDWSEQLIEDYEFHELDINVGLSEEDFDPDNPNYSYRGN